MSKKIIILFALCFSLLNYSQTAVKLHGTILTKDNINDTICFVPEAFLDKKYYSNETFKAKIINNEFNLNFRSYYPQMYVLNLNSEKNNGKFRIDCFFIDSSTTKISFDSNYKLSVSNGKTNTEFLKKFLPYIFKNRKENLHFYKFDESLDVRLCNYIEENPDSYVALWFLIGRFNKEGHTELYEKCMKSFSQKMKAQPLWKILNEEFAEISIKENYKFPEILLKNIDLEPEALQVPESEYTLIDFWFSRCRPCLEELPKWIDLYEKYNSRGLNIISISTDKTENVKNYWQKRVVEKKIPWKNYLDENATFATKEKIVSFPTNYLLNNKGEVIKKNVTPEELEKLLIEAYKIKSYFDNYITQPSVLIKN
ncbi:TlpA family protein disulfide reductase [Flavobacterium ginsenosidimutans]|uniref:TlpA family protein disulfide reductase n=1 Tax=Flavobacterium ginsenosidimutans TaxID=687844 RepID=UPI000DACA281|nr:TlpA disulfide reductase family protein [Flavobacterium ginsenosidimutans]KAF2332267.1 TlpA family protein disulfide reductase [Flavobacterium ginsenosidimutans]